MLRREGGGRGAEEMGGESPDVYRGSGYKVYQQYLLSDCK